MKALANAQTVASILRTNSVIMEVGGSIRRITLDNFMNAINEGNEEYLREVAWCVPLKQGSQSSPDWGRKGNLDMYEQYKSATGRYLLKNNGMMAKLSVNDSSIYADGTPLDESIGHVMVHAPRLYFLVKEDAVTGIPYLWMSQLPISSHFIEELNVGAYKGSISGAALVSRSGVVPAGSRTINSFFTAAQANGKQFGLVDYNYRKWLIMMQLSEFGNANCQATLGNGLTGDNNGSDWQTPLTFLMGATKSLGDSFGAVPHAYTTSGGVAVTGACDVSVLGVENPYALQWEMVQGMYCGKSANAAQTGLEVFLYTGNRMPTEGELATTPRGDYRMVERPAGEGYVKLMHLGENFDVVPKTVGGGSTSYWCDYFYMNRESGQLCLWGGAATDGSKAGLACLSSNAAWSGSYSSIGSRLAYYGKTTIVNGAELASA